MADRSRTLLARQAAQDADQSFFKKWAKVGKKISKGTPSLPPPQPLRAPRFAPLALTPARAGKTGLSDKQVKLYKEAEQSVERGAPPPPLLPPSFHEIAREEVGAADPEAPADEKKKEKFVKAVHKKLTKATAAAAAAATKSTDVRAALRPSPPPRPAPFQSGRPYGPGLAAALGGR